MGRDNPRSENYPGHTKAANSFLHETMKLIVSLGVGYSFRKTSKLSHL